MSRGFTVSRYLVGGQLPPIRYAKFYHLFTRRSEWSENSRSDRDDIGIAADGCWSGFVPLVTSDETFPGFAPVVGGEQIFPLWDSVTAPTAWEVPNGVGSVIAPYLPQFREVNAFNLQNWVCC